MMPSQQQIKTSQNFIYESRIYGNEQLDDFLQLQGDCKIQQVQYLEFSFIRTFFLIIPLTLSIIGLFILKYYVTFRAKVFFKSVKLDHSQNASHIFVKGGDNSKKIQTIFVEENIQYFIYRKLKYKIIDGKVIPVGLNLKRFFSQYIDEQYIKKGLSDHLVMAPNYFVYAFTEMSQPFFLIQYLAAVIYFVQKLASLAILLLSASAATVTLNYILLYISYRKIKQMAQKQIEVHVIRKGIQFTTTHQNIVPGDVFLLKEQSEIPCDCLLLKGQAYANQSSLTGQSVPIGKFPCTAQTQIKQSNRWLYEGSQVLSIKEGTIALAVHTGYTSRRGRIIRKILIKSHKMPQFFKSLLFFLLQVYIVGGIITYFATIPIFLNSQVSLSIQILLFFLFITFCFPPSLPIYFNLAYSCCLARLKIKNIYGTQPQKTIAGTNIKIMCFDKTGTLTQQKVQLHKIYRLDQSEIDITNSLSNYQNLLTKIAFSTCHTVKQFDGKTQGDQIDLRMFLHTNTQMKNSNQDHVRCEILDGNNKYQILRINQYQSKFQSMSVLVHDVQTSKYYVFAKGAPEKMHNYSTKKFNYFSKLVSILSYEGLRTIAFSFKEINKTKLNEYLSTDRQNLLKETTILGIVAFQNKLKDDAVETIKKLKQACIQPKMITGDSIFIAIQTAIRAGILQRQQQVVVIEGVLQSCGSQQQTVFKVKVVQIKDNQFHINQQTLALSDYINSTKTIAVDNDFIDLPQQFKLIPQIKVYSRISPQNKAKIVKTYKAQFKQKRQLLNFIQRITGKPIERVGMAGDGANDLIAIKQADIGMGISNSDASYAATFSITNLLDIDQILRESKSTQRSIIQLCRFNPILSFLSIPIILMLLGEGSFYGDLQLIYLNLTKSIILNLAIPLSRPRPQPTKYKPQSNFLGLQNHLVFWGSAIIYMGGLVASYVYGRHFSGQFQPNPMPVVTFDSGIYYQTFSVTIMFITYNFQVPFLALFIYKSKPWREYLCTNYILLILIIINIFLGFSAFFLTNQIAQFFSLVGLSIKVQITVFVIMIITVTLAFLLNLFVNCLRLHEKQFNKEQIQNPIDNQIA